MPLSDRILRGFLGLLLLLAGRELRADAIVRSMAMQATTIAEYSVEADHVALKLEIGLGHVEAFRNLLPDELYQKLGHEHRDWAERLGRFVSQDLVIQDDRGRTLEGRLVAIEPRPRVKRDDVTGEPLPASEEEREFTIFARLEYHWRERPDALTFFGLRSQQAVDIGYVVYHRGIAVNDFRYLTPAQTLDLDWEDPWYSSFRRRNLRRAYFAPMTGFVYVEPYEVRKEIIARPKDLQDWLDLGLEGLETIPVEIQADLKRRVAEFLREHHVVHIDGQLIEPELARINFLERTLRTSRVIDPPIELDLNAAILGAIFVYPTSGLPERVTLDWDLFNERIQLIPVAAVDQAGPFPSFLEPDNRLLEWQNFLKHPELPTLTAIDRPPTAWERWAAGLRWPSLALGLLLAGWGLAGVVRRRNGVAPRLTAAALVLLLAAGCYVGAGRAELDSEKSSAVVAGLLHNVYRAFDYRDEEQIYDVLARSVDGELLTEIYLETRRGLELASQGGARVKVKQVELVELETDPGSNGGFLATATWNVSGSVGHWGHVHTRRNQYRAKLDISPVDGAWKLSQLKILLEERL